jgi:hypothetical protein
MLTQTNLQAHFNLLYGNLTHYQENNNVFLSSKFNTLNTNLKSLSNFEDSFYFFIKRNYVFNSLKNNQITSLPNLGLISSLDNSQNVENNRLIN